MSLRNEHHVENIFLTIRYKPSILACMGSAAQDTKSHENYKFKSIVFLQILLYSYQS